MNKNCHEVSLELHGAEFFSKIKGTHNGEAMQPKVCETMSHGPCCRSLLLDGGSSSFDGT